MFGGLVDVSLWRGGGGDQLGPPLGTEGSGRESCREQHGVRMCVCACVCVCVCVCMCVCMCVHVHTVNNYHPWYSGVVSRISSFGMVNL